MKIDEMNVALLTKKIMEMLSNHKRTFCQKHNYYDCLNVHFKKIENLIRDNKLITFVLPAFPAKSPNNNKTFSSLPDMGERLALQFLNQFCHTIKEFYSKGAEIVICSDGRVFNDLVKVNDNEVDAYAMAIQDIIKEDLLTNIRIFSLDDYYKNASYETMRKNLVAEYAESENVIKQNIKHNEASLKQFNGIHRFIFEDSLPYLQVVSKNKVRQISKEITYKIVQRSNAWSVLVEKSFPEAIRLSIHPQLCGSNKIGIMLLKSKDAWATPWHRVVLYDGKEHVLIRKKDAENLGAIPIFIKNQFSHYTL